MTDALTLEMCVRACVCVCVLMTHLAELKSNLTTRENWKKHSSSCKFNPNPNPLKNLKEKLQREVWERGQKDWRDCGLSYDEDKI